MSRYSDGYQQALRDVQTAIDNATAGSKGDIRSRQGLNAAETWIGDNLNDTH